MYPYKHYNMGEGMMVYNHDGSIENEIAIIVDKIVEETSLNTDARTHLIDILFTEYEKNSVECIETTDRIIMNCLCESKYNHIKILCEYIDYTRRNSDYF